MLLQIPGNPSETLKLLIVLKYLFAHLKLPVSCHQKILQLIKTA